MPPPGVGRRLHVDFSWSWLRCEVRHAYIASPRCPHELPAFIASPGGTDVLLVIMAVTLLLGLFAVGLLFFRLHTLPERIAHKSQKIQFEIVAVLGLLALFTHIHAFWVAGLLLALIDVPDLGWPLRRMAGSLERIAGIKPGEGALEAPVDTPPFKAFAESPTPAPQAAVVDIASGEAAVAGARQSAVASAEQKDLSHA
jgi:hypothetical protein